MILSSKSKISEKLIYSGAVTALLPFAYGVSLLCIHALDQKFVQENYGISDKIFFPTARFLLFVGAFISNIVLYCFPKYGMPTVITFSSLSTLAFALKTYYFKSIESIFFCNSLMAISVASLIFFSVVYISSRYSKALETRVVLSIASLCFSLGFGLFNFKQNILCVLFSRVFIGFAAGAISRYLPCYLSLISPIEYRSIFSSIYSFALVGGLLFFNALLIPTIGFFLKGSWFLPFLFLVYPSLLTFCIPLEQKSSTDNSFLSLIKNPSAWKSLLFVSGFHIASNLSGINQLALKPESIYGKDYSFHSSANLLLSLVVSFFVGYLLEIFGRKLLTLVSCAILMLGCINFYFKFFVTFTAYLFSFGFNLGMASIPFVILGEIFPEDFISPGAFFGLSCNWLGSAISTIVPQEDEYKPYNGAFIVYLLSTLIFSISVALFFRETKGRTPCFQ